MKNEIGTVIITTLGNLKCKIQFIIELPLNTPIQEFSDSKAREEICGTLGYHCGRFKALLENQGFSLREIEIVIPPIAEYLDLETELGKSVVLKSYESVVISKGILIEFSKTLINEGTDMMNKTISNEIRLLKKGNSTLN